MADLERGGAVLTGAQRTEVLRAVAQSYCCKGGPCMAGGTHNCPAEVQHHWAWKHAEFALAAIGKAGFSIHPAAAQEAGEVLREVQAYREWKIADEARCEALRQSNLAIEEEKARPFVEQNFKRMSARYKDWQEAERAMWAAVQAMSVAAGNQPETHARSALAGAGEREGG